MCIDQWFAEFGLIGEHSAAESDLPELCFARFFIGFIDLVYDAQRVQSTLEPFVGLGVETAWVCWK